MTGNRVEELESRVRELEATVDGLTSELVEAKDRIRLLEEEVDPALDVGRDVAPTRAESAEASGAEASEDAAAEADDATSPGDTTKPAESNDSENDTEETVGDDIIVA